MATTRRTAKDYLGLPYHVELVRDEDADGNVGYVASIRELPGCISQGKTEADAVSDLRKVMKAWLEVALDRGDPIPLPEPEVEYSGQTVLRMPTSLHATLAERAKRENTSLNQLMVMLLSGAAGQTNRVKRSRANRRTRGS